ncbi:hypothetical protein BV22DRAFT_1027127 [Leucogyrophana mollusca]|uniref:Uncharacterized protein n=1 Tax=Leucogyrophana mollusca TaxID=85980 RepID=A0ACB8AUF8_9AGAM|nr:hypothetical protein BV22DRAFT_1027127 [Leucogyrophana mollusca]
MLIGVSQLIVVPTSRGKTSLFYGPLLVVQHLLKNPRPGIGPLPQYPVIMEITPLNALGDSQASEMDELGIHAISVNAEALQSTAHEGRNLVTEIRHCEWSASPWSPERLIDHAVDGLLRDPVFRENILLLAIDETHIIDHWGKAFRKAYQQIGLLRKQLPAHVPLVAVTDTLVPGAEQANICKSLGLHDNFYFMCQSCERPNVHVVIRELTHSLTGMLFPDVDWVLENGEKVVIYSKTLDLCFRVALYHFRTPSEGPYKALLIMVSLL